MAKLNVALTFTAKWPHISSLFTRLRRTDTPEVGEAIGRGDFADARWLRCEHQLELLEDAPSADRDVRRGFIVTSSDLLDMGDLMVQLRPPGARVH